MTRIVTVLGALMIVGALGFIIFEIASTSFWPILLLPLGYVLVAFSSFVDLFGSPLPKGPFRRWRRDRKLRKMFEGK